MANPLAKRETDQATGRNSEAFLREWCWKRNLQAKEGKWPHWIYVSRDKETGTLTCKARTGADAMDVIKVLRGWKPDFRGWDQERLDAEFRILRHMGRMGMPDEETAKFPVLRGQKQLEPA